jgi:hypothetical protein
VSVSLDQETRDSVVVIISIGGTFWPRQNHRFHYSRRQGASEENPSVNGSSRLSNTNQDYSRPKQNFPRITATTTSTSHISCNQRKQVQNISGHFKRQQQDVILAK